MDLFIFDDPRFVASLRIVSWATRSWLLKPIYHVFAVDSGRPAPADHIVRNLCAGGNANAKNVPPGRRHIHHLVIMGEFANLALFEDKELAAMARANSWTLKSLAVSHPGVIYSLLRIFGVQPRRIENVQRNKFVILFELVRMMVRDTTRRNSNSSDSSSREAELPVATNSFEICVQNGAYCPRSRSESL